MTQDSSEDKYKMFERGMRKSQELPLLFHPQTHIQFEAR